jgi:hypothetical protein
VEVTGLQPEFKFNKLNKVAENLMKEKYLQQEKRRYETKNYCFLASGVDGGFVHQQSSGSELFVSGI